MRSEIKELTRTTVELNDCDVSLAQREYAKLPLMGTANITWRLGSDGKSVIGAQIVHEIAIPKKED